MSIAVTPFYDNTVVQIDGPHWKQARLVVTGLTGGAANTIPHGLPGQPFEIDVVPYSTTGAAMAAPTLDGSSHPAAVGVAGGSDATNIYVITASGVTMCMFNVRY